MQKLSDKQILYVSGTLDNLFGNGVFSHLTQTDARLLELYNKLNLRKESNTLTIMDSLYNDPEYDNEKKIIVKEYQLKHIEDKKNVVMKQIQDMSIRLWYQENLIVQVKRPDSFGNKGDYTSSHEEKNDYYNKHPIFVKFDSKEMLEMYHNILDDLELYTKWFDDNGKKFTMLNINN